MLHRILNCGVHHRGLGAERHHFEVPKSEQVSDLVPVLRGPLGDLEASRDQIVQVTTVKAHIGDESVLGGVLIHGVSF